VTVSNISGLQRTVTRLLTNARRLVSNGADQAGRAYNGVMSRPEVNQLTSTAMAGLGSVRKSLDTTANTLWSQVPPDMRMKITQTFKPLTQAASGAVDQLKKVKLPSLKPGNGTASAFSPQVLDLSTNKAFLGI
jgi:hypothetical protein